MHSTTTTTTFFIIVISVAISTCYSQGEEQYYNCTHNFSCGPNVQNVGYPFWGDGRPQYCGHPSFELKCQNEYPTIQNNNRAFRVLEINQSTRTTTIASSDLWETNCAQELHNITLDNNNLRYGLMNQNLFIFYYCASQMATVFPDSFTCETGGTESRVFYTNESLYNEPENSELTTTWCSHTLKVPVFQATVDEILEGSLTVPEGLRRGFEVVYDVVNIVNCPRCEVSGGICGSNSTGFVCHCPDGTEPMTCQNRAADEVNIRRKLVIGVPTGGGIMIILLLCLCIIVKKLRQSESIFFWKTKTENYQKIEAFLKNCGSLSLKRYTYSDIKKITDSFRTKLGQGGFGCVYKGKLENGCLVAVKVLKGLKGNGDEFINEVATISRTSHVHIVTLLGFCFEGRHRALLYEFMPNGSLDKFIHDGGLLTNRQLGWEALSQIAVGIARGLEYLHRGCNTRILHFDIKPHNILLNEDFRPKISDFGLAKLCPQKDSIVSLLGARGTAGYIAPEVFSRNFGVVSHKSDVYSYGMMVLEMVGQRKNNVSVEVDHTSETYFPHWVYKRLEQDEELGSDGITGDEANASTRKMIIVACGAYKLILHTDHQ